MKNKITPMEVGDDLPPLTKTMTEDKINGFEGLSQIILDDETGESPRANIHTDPQIARERGLERPVASGQMAFAYLHELLARQFGIDFRQGGQLSATFLKPVYAGDVLSVCGRVTGVTTVEHRTQFSLQVWVENQNAEKTAVGKAEVTVPSPLT